MTDPTHAPVRIVEHSVAAPATTAAIHPLVQAAMASQDIDVEKLRQLLAMQTEWEAREAKKAFTHALAELKRDLPPVIAKDATVDFTSAKGRTFYKHASLAGVMDQVNEPLFRHGFAISWRPGTLDGKVQVTCRLTHAGGHHEEVTLAAAPDASGSKSGPQAIASTITLLERYSALALLGIATADMREPTGDDAAADASSVVEPDRNLAAAGWLKKKGIAAAEAEALVGRRVSEWTAADLDKIKWQFGDKKPAEGARATSGKTIADADAEPPDDYDLPQ